MCMTISVTEEQTSLSFVHTHCVSIHIVHTQMLDFHTVFAQSIGSICTFQCVCRCVCVIANNGLRFTTDFTDDSLVGWVNSGERCLVVSDRFLLKGSLHGGKRKMNCRVDFSVV
jgi:hypothetical protein